MRAIDADKIIEYCTDKSDDHFKSLMFVEFMACIDEMPTINAKEIVYAEWKMVVDDYDDGFGNRELPHCTNCHRGVYRHDAGSWCPFCGAAMKNPMR